MENLLPQSRAQQGLRFILVVVLAMLTNVLHQSTIFGQVQAAAWAQPQPAVLKRPFPLASPYPTLYGESAFVWDINLIGNKSFNTDELRDEIKSKYSAIDTPPREVNQIPIMIDEAKNGLVKRYRQRGYFDVEVEYKIEYSYSSHFVTLTYLISEGEQYDVRQVKLVGNASFPEEQLIKMLQLRPKDSFDDGKRNQDEATLQGFYAKNGFKDPQVITRLMHQPKHEVDIVYSILEGDRCEGCAK
jgi:outer membrane protein insertion porin family